MKISRYDYFKSNLGHIYDNEKNKVYENNSEKTDLNLSFNLLKSN